MSENQALFARIEALWEARDALDLTAEQARVLMLTRRGFVRAGAQLEAKIARKRLRDGEIAAGGAWARSFTQNLLADERDWFMELAEDDLDGLPDFVDRDGAAAGEEKGAGGPVVTLSRSLIVPFLQFSARRDLREKAYEAWVARGREWRRDRQPRDCRRDAEAARGTGAAAGL